MSSSLCALVPAFLVPANVLDKHTRSALSTSRRPLPDLLPAAVLAHLRRVPFRGARLGHQLLRLVCRKILGSATPRGWHPSSTTRSVEWLLSPHWPLTIGNGFFVNLMLTSLPLLRRQRGLQISVRGRPFTCAGSAPRCRSYQSPLILSEPSRLR